MPPPPWLISNANCHTPSNVCLQFTVSSVVSASASTAQCTPLAHKNSSVHATCAQEQLKARHSRTRTAQSTTLARKPSSEYGTRAQEQLRARHSRTRTVQYTPLARKPSSVHATCAQAQLGACHSLSYMYKLTLLQTAGFSRGAEGSKKEFPLKVHLAMCKTLAKDVHQHIR